MLWCFLNEDAVPFAAIKAKTNIEDGELRRTMQSLACGKVHSGVGLLTERLPALSVYLFTIARTCFVPESDVASSKT